MKREGEEKIETILANFMKHNSISCMSAQLKKQLSVKVFRNLSLVPEESPSLHEIFEEGESIDSLSNSGKDDVDKLIAVVANDDEM